MVASHRTAWVFGMMNKKTHSKKSWTAYILTEQKLPCKSPTQVAKPKMNPMPLPQAPSPIHYGELDYAGQNLITPKELTTDEVKELVGAFANSVKRAVDAGFDAIELHGAHGYLIHQFYSPKSNTRTDEYGQDKALFGVEVIAAAKKVMLADMPLIVRISAQEYGKDGFDSDYGVEIAK